MSKTAPLCLALCLLAATGLRAETALSRSIELPNQTRQTIHAATRAWLTTNITTPNHGSIKNDSPEAGFLEINAQTNLPTIKTMAKLTGITSMPLDYTLSAVSQDGFLLLTFTNINLVTPNQTINIQSNGQLANVQAPLLKIVDDLKAALQNPTNPNPN